MTSMKGIEDLSYLDCLELASIANLDGTEVPFYILINLDSTTSNYLKAFIYRE